MDEDTSDKALKFKRGMEKLGLSPVKAEEYVSPLNEATMKFKGLASSADVTPAVNVVKGLAENSNVTPIRTIVKGFVDNADVIPTKTIIKGVTDKINTNEIQKVMSGIARQDKIKAILESRAAAKAAKLAGGTLKAIPFLGTAMGIGSALMSGEASAAIPVLNEAENAGPTEGSLEAKLEGGIITPDEMQQLLARSKNGR